MRQRFTQFRAGRWQRFRNWLGLGALVVAAAVLGVAAAANARVPMLHWQFVGHIPARGRSARALALDPQSETLYAGMEHGLFVSRDGGAQWEPLLANGETISASALAVDARQALLYGSDGEKIFRWAGGDWQVFTLSAANGARNLVVEGRPAIWALAADERRGMLYVGTLKEFLRSQDGGETWEWVSSLPAEGQALALDEAQGEVYVAALAHDELYRSRDGGRTWSSLARDSVGVPLAYLAGWGQWGVMGRWIDGNLFWAAENMQGLWKLPRAILESQNCVVRPLSSSRAELLCAWGLMLMKSDLQAMPLPWLAVRLWIWQVTAWVAGNVSLAVASLAICVGLMLVTSLGWAYMKISRPWGVPVWVAWVAWFAPGLVERYACPAALEEAWPAWEKRVRAELARFDEVIPADLIGIPAPLRRYVLQRYAKQNAPLEWLEVHPGLLRVREEAGTRRWRDPARRPSHNQPDPEDSDGRVADAQAKLLGETLGVSLGEPQVLAGARVYWAGSAALPIATPAHMQLMVLETAWMETVNVLADWLQRNPDVLGLLVLLDGEAGAAELRQAATHFASMKNFVALSQDEVSKLLMARSPRQVLADLIVRPAPE